ncbi:MAG: phytoene desaturase family protein [Treponemataceae bacterium]
MKEYDVIVIGSGNGGLSAACKLAKEGKKVAVFETHNIPGGCGTTFKRGRFEFEVALHQLNAIGSEEHPGLVRQIFNEYGIFDEIDWIQIKSLYKINLPSARGVTLPADRKEVQELLCKEFPHEADNIIRYYKMVYDFAAEIFAFKAKAGNSSGEPSALKRAIMKLGFPKVYPTLHKYGCLSTQDVLDEFFEDQELQLCLSAYWCFMGVPPTKFPFSILGLCTYGYIEEKPYYLKGGSQVMSMALTEAIRKFGSDVFLNNRVKRIIIEDNKAVGIVDSHDVEYRCKVVISNISPIHTYAGLLKDEEIPEDVNEYFKSYKVGISGFVLFIGLDCKPEDIGFTDSFNLIYSSLDANEDFKNSKLLDCTKDPIVATCYTIDDPSVSPEGTSIISTGILKYGDAWERLSPSEYHETKFRMARELLDRLEKRFPGLIEHIEEMEIATPLTFEHYLNHPGGAIYGFEQDLKSSVFFYPNDRFIKNLEFSSGWVNVCGFGPNYIYGYNLAKKLLSEGI